MKAKDLMIGDLIKTDSTSWDDTLMDKYCKVEFIGSNSLRCSLIDDPKRQPYGQETSFEPIPLTPEILEKNGIKWLSTEPSGRRTYCCNKPVIHCTYFPNSGWLVCVGACGSNKVRFVEISKVQHVHQLQHALRLYGIDDKEIIL